MGTNRLRLDGGGVDKITVNACELVPLQVRWASQSVTNLLCAVFSWGRGDHGALGHGDTDSNSMPRVIPLFNALRVVQVAAGLWHVLVLTELDGLFAFGGGVHGKLGVGKRSLVLVVVVRCTIKHYQTTDTDASTYQWRSPGDVNDRCSPVKVQGLDGLNVVQVGAGDEHSIAVAGETFFNRQVYSWGLGENGCVRV